MSRRLSPSAAASVERIEDLFDGPFGAANPLRHLGALGFLFFWIIALSGVYLYAVLDTSVNGAYRSIDGLTRAHWTLGGLMRSLHRYAADAFIAVTLLHLLRELLLGRFRGFRWFTWISGVPLLWLAYASGIGGFWIAWDQVAQFSAIASAEWLDWLPVFSDPMTRNFLTPESVTDRLFSLLVFIHIGVPLMLLFGLWFHVQRVSSAEVFPPRSLAIGTLLMLLVLALAQPVTSAAPANLALAPASVALDWFYLFPHPLMYASSPAVLWGGLAGVTLLLLLLPLLPRQAMLPIAVVNPANCNGCRRCFADCPYAAVTMIPHPSGKPGRQLASINAGMCASCGICAGACPSSTPFRSVAELVTGIDMPQQPVGALRAGLETKLAALDGAVRIVAFGCAEGADVRSLERADTAVLSLICTGMLPPSFVEYALRGGAHGVLVTGCREGDCAYRLGNRWTEQRLSGEREPHLRGNVPPERLRVAWAGARDGPALAHAVEDFRRALRRLEGHAAPKRMAHRG